MVSQISRPPSLPNHTQRTMPVACHTPEWGRIGKEVLDRDKAREEKIHKRPCLPKHEYADMPLYQKMQNSGRMRLESFEKAMRYYFEHSEMKLGYMQKRLIDILIVTALRKFFTTDLISNLRYLSTKFMIDELPDAVAILFPRRSGKTEGSAWFIAVVAVSQPDWNSIMYNLTSRQARGFLQTVRKHLDVFKEDPEFGWTLEGCDVREFVIIRTRKYGSSNSIKSYPCALNSSDATVCLFLFGGVGQDFIPIIYIRAHTHTHYIIFHSL